LIVSKHFFGRYFFRVVEQRDRSWSSRRGQLDVAWFNELEDAIEHTTGMASKDAPSEVFVHHLDGRAEVIATFE
jgi:hypothetical protein